MGKVSEIKIAISTDKTIAKINQLKSLLKEVEELADSLGMPIAVSVRNKS